MKPSLILRVFVCLLVSISIKAQYVVTPILPPPNFTFNDLWQLTVIRGAADDNSQFYITLRIYDETNALKVKSNTSVLVLPAGTHYYNLSNISQLQPFVTSYYDASILQQAVSSGGMFPPGIYNIVYTLYGKAADGEFMPLTEDASQATVEALWPPMLLSPPDGDSIDTQYPLLTWTPAFSSAYGGQITYTLNLVELAFGQNAYQAIVSNPVYFTQSNIIATLLPYPPSAQLLDTTKIYAWQVHADVQGASLGSSEVWTFTWRKPKKQTQKVSTYYAILKPKPETSIFLATEDLLRFTYEDNYVLSATEKIRYYIYDEKRKLKYDFQNCEKCKVMRNQKYYSIEIGGINSEIKLERNKVYYLEVLNDKNQKLFLKFMRM